MQNSSSKTIGIVVVLIIIVVGIWLVTRNTPDNTGANPYSASQSQSQMPTSSTSVSSTDSSDTALDKDSAAIDAQLGGLSSDNSAAQSAQ